MRSYLSTIDWVLFLIYFAYDGVLRRVAYIVLKRRDRKKRLKALWQGLRDLKRKRFYKGPQWLHQFKSTVQNEVSVVMLPYTEKSPYLKLLSQSLEKHEVLVEKKGRFDPFWLWLNKGRVNLLHFHWPSLYYQSRKYPVLTLYRLPLFLFSICFAKCIGYKIVWTVHNLYPHESVLPVQLNRWLRRLWVRQAVSKMIVHSPSASEIVKEEFKTDKPVTVIPHGHFLEAFPNNISKEVARGMINVPKESFTILYFGVIRAYKGVEILLETFIKVKGTEDVLLIVGQPLDKKLSQHLSTISKSDSRIKVFLTYVPSEDVQIYFNACDVVVLPYKDILTSGNLLLAMSFAKPVIVPAMGCIEDTVDSSCAILYDPHSESGLEEAISMAKKKNLNAMGQNAYEKARLYDWDSIAKKTLEVYKEVLK